MTILRKEFVLVGLIALVIVTLLAPRSFAQGNVTFGPPVKVTPPDGFGYEPSFVVDRFGNIFATAHKENWQLLLAPDANSPTFTRSMSWAWLSVDGGNTWGDIPGLTPLSIEQHQFGDEGDMALTTLTTSTSWTPMLPTTPSPAGPSLGSAKSRSTSHVR